MWPRRSESLLGASIVVDARAVPDVPAALDVGRQRRPRIRTRYNSGMSLTLVVPVSLAQAAEQLTRLGVRVAGLEALLATATLGVSDVPLDSTLGIALGISGSQPVPFGALRRASEPGITRDDAYWLCADPVCVALLRDAVQIDGLVTDLADTETSSLLAAFNAAFDGDGLEFSTPHPSRWYVRCASAPDATFTPLWRAVGHSMGAVLPAGTEGPHWRARLNEAQMILHAHPVNDARESAGLTRVGSLWWWGGGRWPEFGPATVDRVVGGPLWIGPACVANRIAFIPEADDPDSYLRAGPERLLVIPCDVWESSEPAHQQLVDLDRGWFSPLWRALGQGRLDTATIHFALDDQTLTVQCAPRQRSRWQRLFGRGAGDEPPSIGQTLQAIPQ